MDCEHVRDIDKSVFKQLLKERFGNKERKGQGTLASLGQWLEGSKDEGKQTETVLHCEACADGVCHTHIWLCMHCGVTLCHGSDASHALQHLSNNPAHCLFLQTHDSHLFCASCCAYVYPRELARTSGYDSLLDPIIYEWLVTLGKARLWWRKLDSRASPGVRGIRNFGNTCFFTSTCQALLHLPLLREELEAYHSMFDESEERIVQASLRELFESCWADGRHRNVNAHPLFKAIQREALYLEYDENSMEDSNSLFMDIMGAMSEKLVSGLFSIKMRSVVTCSVCEVKHKTLTRTLSAASGGAPLSFASGLPAAAAKLTADFAVGAASHVRFEEITLSLALASEASQAKISSAGPPGVSAQHKSASIGMALHQRFETEDGRATPLVELIDRLFVSEPVPDFKCAGCGKVGESVSKQISVERLPRILVVQLKRFAPLPSGELVKVHWAVDLPKVLDLGHLITQRQTGQGGGGGGGGGMANEVKGGSRYVLRSIIVHDGGMGGGHNMAYVRGNGVGCAGGGGGGEGKGGADGEETEDEWTWFSDLNFGPASAEEVDAAEPYLVFFERI